MFDNPFVAMAALANAGLIDRPPVHAYEQHPEWRKVSMHALDMGGVEAADDFTALEALRAVEKPLFHTPD